MAKVPRATIKKLFKKHQPQYRLAKTADIWIYLQVVLFIKKLATRSAAEAKKAKLKTIQPEHIKQSLKETLAEMHA